MPSEPHPSALHARQLHEWCLAAGIYGAADRVQRVVIDINVQDVVRVFVEKVGDSRVLAVEPFRVGWVDPDGAARMPEHEGAL